MASSFMVLQILSSVFLYLGCLTNSNNCFTLRLLEILFSLTPTCDFSLRTFPMNTFKRCINMGTYLFLYYILRENKFIIISWCTFKRLILFPEEVYLERKKSLLMLYTCCLYVVLMFKVFWS